MNTFFHPELGPRCVRDRLARETISQRSRRRRRMIIFTSLGLAAVTLGLLIGTGGGK